ncbi:MAG: excisionase family DNA-binding protein [Deltaproteobacteria bacterium]|nr:excisionase family DNA-binding protein [Deltaproteobacteria bacterium]
MNTLYTPEELAKLWKVSKMTIYKLLSQNKIPHFKVGKAYRIPQDHLDLYMKKEGNLASFDPLPTHTIPKVAENFVTLLKKEPIGQIKNVVKIILFGSYARGTPHADSDVDLLLVVKILDSKTEHWVASLSDKAMAANDYTLLLSVLRMSEAHWQKQQALQTPLFEEIKKEGILLWPT